MTGARRRRRDERGAAVVVALALAGLLVFVAGVSAGTVVIVLAHRRAQAAADLGALAGAAALQRDADACAAAARIVARHDSRMTRCTVAGATLIVVTSVRLPSALGAAEVPARARAGPVAPPGEAVLPGQPP